MFSVVALRPWPQQLQPTGIHCCWPWPRQPLQPAGLHGCQAAPVQLLQPAGFHCCQAVPVQLLGRPLEPPLVQHVAVMQLQPTGFHCPSWAPKTWAASSAADTAPWLAATLLSLPGRRGQATMAAVQFATESLTMKFQRYHRHAIRRPKTRTSPELDERSWAKAICDSLGMPSMRPNSASSIPRHGQ